MLLASIGIACFSCQTLLPGCVCMCVCDREKGRRDGRQVKCLLSKVLAYRARGLNTSCVFESKLNHQAKDSNKRKEHWDFPGALNTGAQGPS